MKNVKVVTKKVKVETVVSYTCDCCLKTEDDDLFYQEWIHLQGVAGYASRLGDGNRWSLTVCDQCLIDIFGDKIKFEDQTP